MGSSGSEHPARVGVTTYLEHAAWGVWNRPAALLPATYVDGVAQAGGLPVLLPPLAGVEPSRVEAVAAAAAAAVDGLVVAGGPDVEPARYGADRSPETGPGRPDRDAWELALVRSALARDIPVLGVCRGMQVLNVALGGTLVQHLPHAVGHEGHQPGTGILGTTAIRLAPGSRLARVLGEQVPVLCYHHQALSRLGRGVRAVGWAADGTVEAMELPERAFAVGIQWHPEEDATDRRLFTALVTAAAAAATTPTSTPHPTISTPPSCTDHALLSRERDNSA